MPEERPRRSITASATVAAAVMNTDAERDAECPSSPTALDCSVAPPAMAASARTSRGCVTPWSASASVPELLAAASEVKPRRQGVGFGKKNEDGRSEVDYYQFLRTSLRGKMAGASDKILHG